MATKKAKFELTIVQAYKRLDSIMNDFRNESLSSYKAASMLYDLNREAKEAGLGINVDVSEFDLDDTELGGSEEVSEEVSESY